MLRKNFLITATVGLISCNWDLSNTQLTKGRCVISVKLDGGIDSLALLMNEKNYGNLGRHMGDIVRYDNIIYDKLFFEKIIEPCLSRGIRYSVSNSCGFYTKNNSHFLSSNQWELNSQKNGFLNESNHVVYQEGESDVLAGSHQIITKSKLRQYSIFRGASMFDNPLKSFLSNEEIRIMDELLKLNGSSDILSILNSGIQILSYSIGGFDTHSSQNYKLKQSLELFYSQFENVHGLLIDEKTILFVYSEFGRTVDFNSSRGTDHGLGGICLVMGGDSELHTSLEMAECREEKLLLLGSKLVLEPQYDAQRIKNILKTWQLN
jgi:hypothetical protein